MKLCLYVNAEMNGVLALVLELGLVHNLQEKNTSQQIMVEVGRLACGERGLRICSHVLKLEKRTGPTCYSNLVF